MTAGCPACGGLLPDGARFCPSCGRPVGGAVMPGDRRVVTVVFADLAGFTTLAEGRDPEAVKETLDDCFGALVPVVERYGGYVDKIIGDELMAVFGAPVAHEDDPERAVRAALDLLPTLSTRQPDLDLRIGVNTGEVLAGPVGPSGAYTVTGDTVNTAHRLVTVAKPGEVLVGERTYTATAATIDYDERPPYELRGKHAPVNAWAARGTRVRESEGAIRWSAPLTGRDAELDELTDAAMEAMAGREPVRITVVGEPGVGKTRLAQELQERLRGHHPHAVVLWGRCSPFEGGGGLWPIAEMVRAGLGIDASAPAAEQRQRLDLAVAAAHSMLGADVAQVGRRLAQLLGLTGARPAEVDTGPSPTRGLDELLTAAQRTLEAIATRRPVVLVVDDAHWGDDALLTFLDRLTARVGRVPLVLVVVGRDELRDRSPALVAGGSHRQTVVLGPLAHGAARSLLLHLLTADSGPAVIPARTEERLLDAAGGNPFLLEEIVRYLVDIGAAVRDDGVWRLEVDPAEVGLPDGIRSLLLARLDALSPEEQAWIHDAAVVGRSFSLEEIGALGDHGDSATHAAALIARGLIVPADDGRFAFRHALTREVAYAGIPIADRAQKHRLVANWLREHFAPEGEAVGLMAHHASRAVLASRELEHTDPALAAEAHALLAAAGAAARGRDALEEADHWFTRARELGTFDRPAAAAVAMEHGLVLLRRRQLEQAARAFEEAAVLNDPGSDEQLTAILHSAVVCRLAGQSEPARNLFAQAQHEWHERGDVAREAEAVRLQGWADLVTGRARVALPRLERALDLERSLGDEAVKGDTLQCLGWCQYLVGDLQAAKEHLWNAADLQGAEGDLPGAGWSFAVLAFALYREGRVAQARDIADNLLHLARSYGDPWATGMCASLQAMLRIDSGDPKSALPLLDEADALFREINDAWGRATAALARGYAGRAMGSLESARAALAEGLIAAREIQHVGDEARLLVELAAVELDAGDHRTADHTARAGLGLVRSGVGELDTEQRALWVLADVAAATDDAATAQLLLEEAIGLGGETSTSTWRLATASLAQLLAAQGAPPNEVLALAAAACAGAGESARTWAIAQRALATGLAANGKSAAAASVLSDILRRFEGTSLAFLRPIREDLRRLQGPTPTTTDQGAPR